MTDTLSTSLRSPLPSRLTAHDSRLTPTLLGIATATPPSIPQSLLAGEMQRFNCHSDSQRAFLQRVFQNTGIQSRGSVLNKNDNMEHARAFYPNPATPEDPGPTTAARMTAYAQEAPPLAARAAAQALQNASLASDQITHLITTSCTGFFAPGLDYELIQRLKLRPDIQRLHIGFMGCHAAFNALNAATAILHANPNALILICSVELPTLHFAYGFHPQKLVANALFADGASATILGNSQNSVLSPQSSSLEMRNAKRETRNWSISHSASLLLENSRDAMTWLIGNHGFTMTLSAELPNLIEKNLRLWVESFLAEKSLTLADIQHFALHPGGPKILQAIANALALPPQALASSQKILADHGNMSSATLLFLLEQIAKENPTPGPPPGPTLALGFGPGLIAEAILLSA